MAAQPGANLIRSADPSKADARAWCVKVKKVCVVNIAADGGLSFKNMSFADQRAIEAIRDRAKAAFDGLVGDRNFTALASVDPRLQRQSPRQPKA